MTPKALSKLVIEMIGWKKVAAVSESCVKIKRLIRSGVAMNTSVK